ncbi:hypothetical protein Tco_0923077 [Tanacetum coccineum]|uniref:Uncharacterized protein n=1 Tax=Tanacetum coccineum TaxID=301880 RepID=A0ABQ5D2D3_9ASTR
MITEEMKHIEHYRIYVEVFGIDVPLTQSQPTESTQGTHRTPSAPRRSTRLTPPTSVPNVDKADEMILQDTLKVSLAKHKSREEQEARENVSLVDDTWNEKSNIPNSRTRIEPRSNKESPEVEITKDKEVEITKDKEVEITKETPVVDITNVVIPVNVNDEDEEITDEEFTWTYGYLFAHLRARFMPRKSFDTLADNLHDVMVETLPTIVDKHIKEQVMKQVPEQVRNQVPVYVTKGLILERQKAKEETERLIAKAILQEHQQYQLYLAMKADPQLQQQDIAIWLALQMKFERNTVQQIACRTPVVRPRDQDVPHDDAYPESENSAKRQKTSEYEAYVSGESSFGQVFQEEQAPSTSGNQEQDDEFDFWTDSYASDDDEIPTKQVSQDIMEEVSLTIDEAKLRKMADEMLRQRCTLGDEHQYHIDQKKNFLKSDIVWESRKEILVSPHLRKTTPLVHSCQQDPEAPALSLINQDLLYLKIGNFGPEKIVLPLHKFPAVIFNDDDIEERTSRWLNTAYPLPSDMAYLVFCPIQSIHLNILIRLRMTKVIKGEFEKIKDVKVEDVSLTCDTPLEVFNNEVIRLSGMDDDLFTYEVEVANIPCNSNMDDDSEHEANNDMGYDPSDYDEVKLTDEESSDDIDEVAEVFRVDTNLFDFETHVCKAFEEFNYLLKIDPDLLTNDIEGFKTYEDYKNDWIYEWNKDVPWVDEKPWTNIGVWTKPTPAKHTCKPFNYKTGCSEWPTCSWKDDGYCNGGNLLGTYIIGNQLHYQDYEIQSILFAPLDLLHVFAANRIPWDCQGGLGSIKEDDDESRYEQKRRCNIYTNNDDAYEINHEDNEIEELCELHELSVCYVRRYMLIKYLLNNDEEYVAVKEDEYDDLTIIRKEACRAYHEIIRIMDEGWMVTRAE